jgi:uncharacterized membrane protein
MPGAADPLQDVNPLHLIYRVFYNMADSITQMVGLSPYQLIAVLFGLVVVLVVVQMVLAARGAAGWHVQDVRDGQAQDQMRRDLDPAATYSELS